MSDETQAVADRLKAEQIRIEDLCLRLARDNGWCDEINRALNAMFPEGPSWPNRYNTFTSSVDGRDCQGSTVWDDQGYNRLGFDRDGRDRDGYDRAGLDLQGFNRDGIDTLGVHRDDPARFRYNVNGWDAEGYNAAGYDREGYTKANRPARVDQYVYDSFGYTAEGYNAHGYDRKGFDAEGYSQSGFDADGFNRSGFDRNGRDRNRIDNIGMRVGADGVRRVADLARFRAQYGANALPEDFGREAETPEQSAAILLVIGQGVRS
jgi:hypothetical protein